MDCIMTKTILGISFAALFAVLMTAMPIALASGHTSIVDDSSVVTTKNNAKGTNERIKVNFETTAVVPLDGLSGAFGYAILTEDGVGSGLSLGNVLVLVTHLPIDDSDFEEPVSGLHTHVLDLISPTSDCSGYDFEVDLAASGANAGFDLNADYAVDGTSVEIGQVPIKLLNSATVEAVVAFTVTPFPDAITPTNLCGTITDVDIPT